MSNPAKPKITFPLDRIPFVNTFNFLAVGDHPDANANFGGFLLRRRAVSSVLGTYEYYNAGSSSWQAGTITNSVATFAPLSTLVIGGFGFTSGTRYQVDIQLRDTPGLVMSVFSDPVIIMPLAIATIAVTQPVGAFTASRPKIAWNYTAPAAGTRQVFWRTIVYEDSTSNVFWDSGYRYDPERISAIMEADCRTGHTYYFQMSIYDENNIAVGSPIVGPFTCTLNLPAAPTVAFTPEPSKGTMLVEVTSAFNLLSTDTADMITAGSIGGWSDVKNANSTYDNTVFNIGTASLRITAAGKSYGYLDTESGTYGNEDTLYTDYQAEITSMEP